MFTLFTNPIQIDTIFEPRTFLALDSKIRRPVMKDFLGFEMRDFQRQFCFGGGGKRGAGHCGILAENV